MNWLEEYFGPPGDPIVNNETGNLHNVATTTSTNTPKRVIRFNGAAPTVTGLASGREGRRLTIRAAGGPVVLANESASSAGSNRIVTGTGASATIPQGGSLDLIYDAKSARWSVVGGPSPGGSNALAGFIRLEDVSPKAVGDGVTDDTAAWEAAVALLQAGTYKGILLQADKTYLVNNDGSVHLPYGISVTGLGITSVLKTTANAAVILLYDSNASVRAKHTTLKNFQIQGNSTGANQNGIESGYFGSDGSSRLRIENVTCENLGGRGFSWAYGQTIGSGPQISGCRSISCGYGFYGVDQANCVNCQAVDCTTGLYDATGNISWTGGDITGCGCAVDIIAGGNDGHGILSGAQINHNNIAIRWGALTNGFTIDGCHIYDGQIVGGANSGAGAMPVQFSDCEIDISTYDFTDSLVRFVDCIVDTDYFTAYNETGSVDVEWVGCMGANGSIPDFIGARMRTTFDFSSDADATLSTQQSRAAVIEVTDSGTALTATRAVSSTLPPDAGRTAEVVNRTAQTINFYFSSGTGIAIPTGKTGTIDADGTNAVCRRLADNTGASAPALGAVDPTTLVLSSFSRGSFAGAPWAGVASAGTSGSRSWVVGVDPSVGAALNGYDSADFDGTTQHLVLGGGLAMSDLITTTAYRISLLVEFDSLPAAAGAIYDNPGLVTESGGNFGVVYNADGIHVYHYDSVATTYKVASSAAAPAIATKYAIDIVYDGTNITVSVNAVAGTPVAAGTLGAITGTARLGANYSATVKLNGRIWDVYTAQSALGSVSSSQHKAYLNGRYAESL